MCLAMQLSAATGTLFQLVITWLTHYLDQLRGYCYVHLLLQDHSLVNVKLSAYKSIHDT